MEEEVWVRSTIRDIWWVSNFGRVRTGGRYGQILKIYWNPWMEAWVVIARGSGRYFDVKKLVEDAFETVLDDDWYPSTGMASDRLRRPYKGVRNVVTGDIYDSCSDLAKDLGVSRSSVSKHLSGKQKSLKGDRYEKLYLE